MERLIRYTPEEKGEIIHLVEHSDLPVKQTLAELQVSRSTFYEWYRRYLKEGPEAILEPDPGHGQRPDCGIGSGIFRRVSAAAGLRNPGHDDQ